MASNQTNQSIVMAVFDTAKSAENAVEELHDQGFTSDQIRYSGQFVNENFLEGVKDLLIFSDEAQDESQSDIETMLQNMGMTYKEISYYLNEFNSGHFVDIVRPDGKDRAASMILQKHGGTGYKQ